MTDPTLPERIMDRDEVNQRVFDATRTYNARALLPERIEARFWSKVAVAEPDQCWLWTAFRVYGYGRFWDNGRHVPAHRWAYESLVAPIPTGLYIDHLCRNRACVNPWHLEAVPNAVNILRGSAPPARNARLTHCAHGHEFTKANTLVRRRSGRSCRQCHAERSRARRARLTAARYGVSVDG